MWEIIRLCCVRGQKVWGVRILSKFASLAHLTMGRNRKGRFWTMWLKRTQMYLIKIKCHSGCTVVLLDTATAWKRKNFKFLPILWQLMNSFIQLSLDVFCGSVAKRHRAFTYYNILPTGRGSIRAPALREQTQTAYCEGTVRMLTTPWVNTHRTIHGCMHTSSHAQLCIWECITTHARWCMQSHTPLTCTHINWLQAPGLGRCNISVMWWSLIQGVQCPIELLFY